MYMYLIQSESAAEHRSHKKRKQRITIKGQILTVHLQAVGYDQQVLVPEQQNSLFAIAYQNKPYDHYRNNSWPLSSTAMVKILKLKLPG